MKRLFIRFAALLLLLTAALSTVSCNRNAQEQPAADGKLTKAETERIIELARTFRIFGEYDFSESFDMRQYETLVYCLFCWSLPESEVKGYGRVEFDEANKAAEAVIGTAIDAGGLIRTKYKPAEIQTIYSLNDRYYVMLTDDSSCTYTVTDSSVIKNDAGERTGVKAAVKIEAPDGSVCFVFELEDSETGVFSVKKVELQQYD